MEQASKLRLQFLDYLFGDKQHGYLCIATEGKVKGNFAQKFFQWPEQRQIAGNYIEQVYTKQNVWFCVCLLKAPDRKKEFCLPTSFAWADLDYVDPAHVTPAPTCVVESSPKRYHGYWRIAGDPVPPTVAEDFSKRITYANGADKSGWPMNKLLRVPFTLNHKYAEEPEVKLVAITDVTYDSTVLDNVSAQVSEEQETGLEPAPDVNDLPDVNDVVFAYNAEKRLTDEWKELYTKTPPENADWSRIMWRFINASFSIGMTKEEVFVCTVSAKCNKYARDKNRPMSYLWHDVNKAAEEHKQYDILLGHGKIELIRMPHLVDFDEVEEDAFIRDYKTWANNATDAPEQYHELTCFIALSAIVSSGLFVETTWGEIVPNLWGLLLGESTLTRKTTAMRLAVDMLKDIDDDLILATDGSAEGLLSGLSHRPKRVSIFWKDEVSGLFDSINRKDYLAGLPETLTQLYDVPKVLSRVLRKETVTISEPYFIFFGGGIRDKVYSLINDEYILSGFLPRFLIVSGENDVSRLRRTGPPSTISTERKDNIVRSLQDLQDRYTVTVETKIAGQNVAWPTRIEARLEQDAWETYWEYEEILTNAGLDSDVSMLALPTFTRLSFSLLKMALLVAASRRSPNSSNHLIVVSSDVKQAAFYIQKWGAYSVDLILNAGLSKTEKAIQKALALVKKKEGLTRAEFMQRQHLSAKEAKDLIDTMVMRGLINVTPAGRGVRIYSL